MDLSPNYSLYEAILKLRPAAALDTMRACKLCNHPAHPFATVDFNKSCNALPLERSGVLVEYFRCQRCELLFTDFFDRWSADDFSHYIYNGGYDDVDPEYRSVRPLRSASELAPSLAGAEHCRILDYGSGTGAFAVAMNGLGFGNVTSYDPFSQPDRPYGAFDIVTCFDVIEHSPAPRDILSDIMSFVAPGGLALIGQTLQPSDIGTQRGGWWYVAPRNGHVTFFSCETLHLHAQACGLEFADFGDLFALTHADQSDLTSTIIARRRPQLRRIVIQAPAAASVPHEAWHEAEGGSHGAFRWSRAADVCLGLYDTPRGLFRVVIRHVATRGADFLAQSRIRVGKQEQPISVHEGDLFAVFDLPFEAVREISLRTPEPYSEAAAGSGADLRAVGLAIACGRT